jgi:hypothetical protein
MSSDSVKVTNTAVVTLLVMIFMLRQLWLAFVFITVFHELSNAVQVRLFQVYFFSVLFNDTISRRDYVQHEWSWSASGIILTGKLKILEKTCHIGLVSTTDPAGWAWDWTRASVLRGQ